MISTERSKTAQKSILEIQDKLSPRQNAVQHKIQSENFFSTVRIFFQTEFCLELYLSWTEFYLGLNLSWTEFCLRLHTRVVFRMQSFNLFLQPTTGYSSLPQNRTIDTLGCHLLLSTLPLTICGLPKELRYSMNLYLH